MTLENNGQAGILGLLGGARIPGALGSAPLAGHTTDGRGTKRLPGPLKVGPSILLADSAVTKVAPKTLKMTPPLQDNSTRRVHVVEWDLGADSAKPGDVVQGSLANCPVASILAALANTHEGIDRIRKAVTPQQGNVITDLAAVMQFLEDDGEWKDKPNGTLSSKRYFTVELPGIKQEVSDVFYTDEGDQNWGLIYIGMPNPFNRKMQHVLWPSVIEKAYATELKGYDKLDAINDPKVAWNALIGSAPTVRNVKDLKDSDITRIAQAANRVPTIAATRDDTHDAEEKTRVEQQSGGRLEGWHGYAVTGMAGSQIALYDPHGKPVNVTMTDFKKFFTNVVYGNL
jgi:hypothetical protein